MTLSRRSFLQQTPAAAALLALPAATYRAALSADAPPSDTVRLAHVGVGLQGMANLKALAGQKRTSIVAVCDVDKDHLAKCVAEVEKLKRPAPDAAADYRTLLDRKDIDAVVVVTPDHWHALQTIHACKAGKDVYCEKPLSLTIAEGRRMVQAARDNKRVVQTGSHQRSDDKFRTACELVRSGAVGKVHTVKVGLPKVNFSGPAVPDSAPPAELDYDRWVGPAPLKPYNAKHVHYLFRFFWDYSGGQQTNFGAHHLDIAQWGLGADDTGPVSAEAQARFHKDHWFEVPEWTKITYKYADGVTMLCGQDYPAGTEFIGDKGSILVVRGKLTATPDGLLKHPVTVKLEKSGSHHANWLDCIRTRKNPVADVEIGHRSATVCHLGNLAVRSGKKGTWDPAKEQVVGDAEVAKMVDKAYRSPWGKA